MKQSPVLLLLLASFAISRIAATAAPGPVACWTFDDTGDAINGVGTSPTPGHLLGHPSRVAGVLGKALRLDGATQGVEIAHVAALRPAAQITLSAWVLPTELSGNRTIYRKEDGEERTLFAFQDGGSHLSLGLNLGGKYVEFDAKIAAAAFLDEKWHLVTATYDGAFMKIYRDGQQIADGQTVQLQPASGPIATGGNAPLYLGVTTGHSEHFRGFLDDVRLYDRALTAGEIAALYAEGEAKAPEAARLLFATAGADMVTAHAPKALAQALRKRIPVTVTYAGGNLDFTQSAPGVLQNRTGDLVTEIQYEYDASMHALRYQVIFTNNGSAPISGITLEPLQLRFVTAPPEVRPRVRYFTGSFHYDGTYPPRAFQEVERVFMGNDHSKPLEIAGSPFDYVPMIQFAVGPDTALSGFTAAFEWSGPFKYEAGWDTYSFTGEPLSDFHLNGSMALGPFTVAPGKTVAAPRVHLVFFEGNGWTPLENATRRYISERVAYRADGKAHVNKVTYDHWFGIHAGFDLPDMMRQAKRASELGCEYFCVDASWYGKCAFGASGKGEWDQPDPVKFPGGKADFKKLSDYVRGLGMGFGIWHQVETRNGAGPNLDFNVEGDRSIMLETMRNWIKEYHLTWMRWEMAGGGDLNYINHYHEIMAALTHEFPDLNIECCLGGGTRFDLGMIRYCTSTWLSDHTANADVSRFNQTGALHFWPSHLLNLAVRVHRKTGDTEATAYNLISRMPGALSFNGDIAQWSPEATQRMRALVDACKSVRQFQSQPVFYPLPQPRNPRDWDAVCFGDGTGEAQVLYAFRMEGPEQQWVKVPDAKGLWSLVMSSDANVKIEPSGDGFLLSMPSNTAAVWIRK